MIQTFSADRADHALNVGALPGRSRSAEHLLDAHGIDLFSEFVSINPISLSQQIFRCTVERKGFDDLLSRPLCCRMSRDIEMDDAPSIVGKHHKDEQNLKPNGVDREEVDRHQLPQMIGQKGSPGLRWWFWMPDH